MGIGKSVTLGKGLRGFAVTNRPASPAASATAELSDDEIYESFLKRLKEESAKVAEQVQATDPAPDAATGRPGK